MTNKSLPKPLVRETFVKTLNRCLTKSFPIVLMALSCATISCSNEKGTSVYNIAGDSKDSNAQVDSTYSGGGGASGDGGGGQGILCGDTKNPKLRNKLWVRDIYEAIYNHKLTIKNIPTESESAEVTAEAINALTTSLQTFLGPATPNTEIAYPNFWNNFIKQISFLSDGQELHISQDANSPIALPPECKLIQIAYWDESSGPEESGTLYVDLPLWKKLDQVNKVALLAHEYFFKEARKANFKNSDYVRQKVGYLLSTEGVKSNFINWAHAKSGKYKEYLPASRRGFKICTGTTSEDPGAKFQYYQYEGSDKDQHIVISELTSKMINKSLFQNGHFKVLSHQITSIADKPAANSLDGRFSTLSNYSIFSSEFPRGSTLISGLTPQFESFVDDWYDNSGLLIRKRRGVPNFGEVTKQVYSGNPNVEQFWWTDRIQTTGYPIIISFLDPAYKPSINEPKDRILKSREELIATVNEEIEIIIGACKRIDMPMHDLRVTIAKLHSNIDSSLQKGEPVDLKSWDTSISQLNEYLLSPDEARINGDGDPDSSNSKKCAFHTNKKLMRKIPYLLYSLKLNSYSEYDAKEVLGKHAFLEQKEDLALNLMPPGKLEVRISQHTNSQIFQMKCDDYFGTYTNYILRGAKSTPGVIVPNPSVEVAYDLLTEKTETSSTSIHKLAQLLTQNSMESEHLDLLGQIYCARLDSFHPSCRVQPLMKEHLKKEKKLTFISCEKLGYQKNDEKDCVIVYFEKADLSFLIRYSEMYPAQDSSGNSIKIPQIWFLRLIPNE